MRRARDLVPGAALLAGVAGAALVPLTFHWLAGRTLVWGDTQALFAPQRWVVENAVRSFRLPLWNPFSGGGMPFLADTVHGVLHPLSLLVAWLHVDRNVDALVGAYVAGAAIGAALVALELGASRAAAVVAAVLFASSGPVLSAIGYLNLLAGAASLGFCVAGLLRFGREPRPGSLAWAVAGTAALAVSGDPQALAVGCVLALALAWEGARGRGAVRAAAAMAGGLLVAGIQLVPSLVHVGRTDRASELLSRAPEVWALAPWRLPEFVLPGLSSGQDPLADPVFGALAPGRWPPWNAPYPLFASISLGLVPLVLALMAVREGRRGRVLGVLALVLVWVAFGPTLGADAILGHVPIWRAFRYPEKLVAPFTLVCSALAALGFDAVVERRGSALRQAGVAALLALAAVGSPLVASSGLAPHLASALNARVWSGAPHVLGSAALLGAWLLLRGRLGVTVRKVSLAAILWAGLLAASPTALRAGEVASRLGATSPSLAAGEPGARIMTPYVNAPIHAPGQDRFDQVGRVQGSLAYPAYNVRAGLDSLSEYASMVPRRLARVGSMFAESWPLAARRYGVTHVLLDPPQTASQAADYAVATGGGERVGVTDAGEAWAVPHRPWASFAPEVWVAEDEGSALAAVGRAFASGRGTVVVEAYGDFRSAPGQVLSVERGMELLRVEAESAEDGTLVVCDAWWPGWEATIDGVGVPIFPADVLVRAVRWPAGHHVLEMRYRPPEVRTGVLVSLLGVLVLAGWAVFLRTAPTRATSSRTRPSPPAPTGGRPGGPPASASPPGP